MTDPDELIRDLDALGETIREEWSGNQMARHPVGLEDRARIRQHLAWCLTEMGRLLDRLESPR